MSFLGHLWPNIEGCVFMKEKIDYRIYDEAILYYPFLTRDLIKWHPYKNDGYSIVFVYENGDKIFYDSTIKSIRYFNKDYTSDLPINEERWTIEVASNIRREMRKRGIGQQTLSELSGISQSTLSRYTNAETALYAYKLKLIADALECTMDELLDIRRWDTI